MARQLVRALCIWSALTTCLAVPLQKRWDHRDLFNGRHPLQGVEVNGLFNPMERLSLFLLHVPNGPVLPRTYLNGLLKNMVIS